VIISDLPPATFLVWSHGRRSAPHAAGTGNPIAASAMGSCEVMRKHGAWSFKASLLTAVGAEDGSKPRSISDAVSRQLRQRERRRPDRRHGETSHAKIVRLAT
jgi:hypothetical protein